MAAADKSRTSSDEHESGSRNDLRALLAHVRENPMMYFGAVVFLALIVLITSLYRIYSNVQFRDLSTEYARALQIEDPAERAIALEPIAAGNSDLAEEALYLQAEAYFEAGDYDAAQALFRRVREQYPESEFAPEAVAGLGAIEESEADNDGALAYYREVLEKWPDSFASRRQYFNIGKIEERRGNLNEAVGAYQEQLTAFPASNIAQQTRERLTALRLSHPELFPEPVVSPVTPEEPVLELRAPGEEIILEPDAILDTPPADQTDTETPPDDDAAESSPSPPDEPAEEAPVQP